VETPKQPLARKTGNLHIGRISCSGVRYFVTFVTASRKPWLGSPVNLELMLNTLRDWHSRGNGEILAASVMPDHVHILFSAGKALTVGQTVASWKTTVRRQLQYAESFQRDFWEHRLRDNENAEDYALYVFLNPYRAGVLGGDEQWSGWWVPQPTYFRFTELLVHGSPPAEWINWPDERFAELKIGE
jgi:putative transposase